MVLANVIVGLMLFGVAAVLSYFSLEFFRVGLNSVNWPQGQGKITHSYMRKREDEDNVEYLADIEYEYEYENHAYRSTDTRTLGYNKKEAKLQFNMYQPGSVVNFYFDPHHPSKTVQLPGLQTAHYARIVIIALFVFMGLVFMSR